MSLDATGSNPRRRPKLHPLATTSDHPSLFMQDGTDQAANQKLKKSATFQASSTPSGEHDPILNIASIPKRSPTCHKALEDAMVAGDQRITQLLGAVDRSLSGLQSFSENHEVGLVHDESPIPRFLVRRTVNDDHMEMDIDSHDMTSSADAKTYLKRKHHSSDSGIGSSESSEASVLDDEPPQTGVNPKRQPTSTSSFSGATVKTGINGSSAGLFTANGIHSALSEYACRQIQKHIIVPIIREESLKNFHPLVSGIPYRVARREITCLRDLEKVLLWLAPKWSSSKASFVHFCETSIQCIHATVEFLNENDQRRPTDRPYTNGYFLDLVEQIRQYASTLAATRERTYSNTSCSSSDSLHERVTLVGGLSQTGRPAELVRMKGDKMISLSMGEEVTSDSPKRIIKRPLDDETGEDALRSMARRRKNVGPATPKVQRCSECEKVFKRPCDLTKHEKTHSRPWKCSEIGCKYYEYGWPTEKERDRHMNDKHSASPSMFKCHYSPCPYESKRESNCKQHMEKAHGWVYVRSKHNGKNGKRASSDTTPPTPGQSTPSTHVFDAVSPNFSERVPHFDSPMSAHRNQTPSSPGSPDLPGERDVYRFGETFGPIEEPFWPEDGPGFEATVPSQLISNERVWELPLANSAMHSAILPANADDESLFGANFDWSNMGHDMVGVNAQLVTPANSVTNGPLDSFSRRPSASIGTSPQHPPVTSISPGGQGDTMLYSPYSMNEENHEMDEGFDDFVRNPSRRPARDFSLYNDNANTRLSAVSSTAMFDDLGTFSAPQGWSSRGADGTRSSLFEENLLPTEE